MVTYLKPEDYLEPACPFCTDGLNGEKAVHRIDLCRMMEKLDDHLSHNDYTAARRHLYFWLDEARFNNDDQGTLAVWNELMGLHRKCSEEAEAMAAAREALVLVSQLQLEDTVTAATTYVNVGTVYKAFGKAADALPHYRAAEGIYSRVLAKDDARLGGLYNNLALALVDLKEFREADRYYRSALDVMAQVPHGALEQAITWLNMADAAECELGLLDSENQVQVCLARAEALLNTPDLPRNGYYAFVCEKCSAPFRYFGAFAFAQELEARANEIYERT